MEPRSLHQIRAVARVHSDIPRPQAMSKQQRLERWADVLDQRRGQRLRTLERVEFVSSDERRNLRADNSPLTVAFQDDKLRAAGLESDRLGDAMTFFGLSDHQAHLLLCECHYGRATQAGHVAFRIRSIALAENAPKMAVAVWSLWAFCALPVAMLVFSAG